MSEITNSHNKMDIKVQKHALSTFISFGVLLLGLNGMQYAVVQWYPKFYEEYVGLDIVLLFIAAVFYTAFDMINDPLIGYLSDKNTRFTKRFGKRFPWLVIGNIGILFAVILLFSPPDVNISGGLLTFLWFLVLLSVYDGFYSIIFVNYRALLPNKFKSKGDRLKAATISQLFLILGPLFGLLVAPSFLTDDPQSFVIMALFLAFIMLISFILSIYGLKEDDVLKESYLREEISSKPFFQEFLNNLKQSYRQRSFNVFAIYTFCITLTSSMLALSIPYYVEHILGEEETFVRTLNAPFAMTSLLLIPVYFWIIKKMGHVKAMKICLLLTPLPFFLMFISYGLLPIEVNLLIVMLGSGFYGIVGSIAIISSIPVQADFFDESALKFQKRQEGMYSGNWNFYARIITVVQFGILAVIHTITEFDPQPGAIQGDLAKWGIMVHFTLVPAFALIIAGIIFWKYWYLTSEKSEAIKTELEELGL
ncbi:MAG: MFS transporter [Candidatus Kariarchaeaceae archaeon]|jgi:GPH family glycoside/pentoside/hexuronide:cation symporter